MNWVDRHYQNQAYAIQTRMKVFFPFVLLCLLGTALFIPARSFIPEIELSNSFIAIAVLVLILVSVLVAYGYYDTGVRILIIMSLAAAVALRLVNGDTGSSAMIADIFKMAVNLVIIQLFAISKRDVVLFSCLSVLVVAYNLNYTLNLNPDYSLWHVEVILSLAVMGMTLAVTLMARILSDRIEADRLSAENALAESEVFYRAIFENTGTASVMSSMDGTMVLVNNELVKLTGYSKEEMENRMKWQEVICPEDLPPLLEALATIPRDPHLPPRRYEFRLVDKQGNTHYIMESVTFVPEAELHLNALHDVTALKKIEEELRNSEEKFSKIFYASGQAISISRIDDGTIIDANPAFETLTGYSREEVLGLDAAQLGLYGNPDDYGKYRNIIAAGGSQLFEMPFMHRDGRVRYGLVSVEKISMQGESCLLVVGMDISEQKKAEKELALRDEQIRSIAHNLPGVVYQFYARKSGQMGLYYVGERALDYFGIDPVPESFFEKFTAHVADSDRETFLESIARAVQNECQWEYEGRVIKEDGETVWFRGMSTPVKSGDEIVFNGILLNITEQKMIEFQREEALESMKQSEAKYRMLADHAGDVIWTLDMNWKSTYISPSVEKMLGWTVEEWLEVPLEAYITPESLQVLKELFVQELERLKNHSGDPDRMAMLNIEQIRKDGNRFWTEMTIRFLADRDRQPVGILGITRDITERLHMQDLLIQSEKMLTVAGLAAGMAHEINNPLGIIMQSSENAWRRLAGDLAANQRVAEQVGLSFELIKKYVEERKIDQYLKSIHDAGARAARIVSSMLHFSRQAESRVSYLDVNNILEHTLELAENDYDLGKNYDFRNIRVEKNYSPLPNIPCTETELEQVFFNLFKNAAQAMSSKAFAGDIPTVKISTWHNSQSVFVEIEDNGEGMPESTRKHIFEPFYTTKEPGSGTGLGLSVSYYVIVNSHQGQISVDSEPGSWTRFTVELPIERNLEGLTEPADRSSL